MTRFAEVFPNKEIVYTLCRHLSWSHFRLLVPMEDNLQREFYLTMAADQRWSVRTLKAKIDGMLYERTAISRKPELTILNDLEELRNERKMSADFAFHDPYFLDFLGLSDKLAARSRPIQQARLADRCLCKMPHVNALIETSARGQWQPRQPRSANVLSRVAVSRGNNQPRQQHAGQPPAPHAPRLRHSAHCCSA